MNTFHNVDTPELRLISILTVFMMFTIFFFYYKIILTKSLQKVDDTNKKLLIRNQELTDLNAIKDKFFSIVSHDIRGPMHSIVGCAELLRSNRQQFNENELEEFAEAFYSTSKKTCQMVENLLTWSRSQMNGIKVNIESFNLNQFTTRTIEDINGASNRKGIEIINQVNSSIFINADKNSIECILQNLITNALKFSHPGKRILIQAKTVHVNNNKKALIQVIDEGIGMDKKTLSNLFRIDNPQSRFGTNKERGTGLGLILCKEFIEMNKGEIWATSEEGKGSKFYFTVPLSIDVKTTKTINSNAVSKVG